MMFVKMLKVLMAVTLLVTFGSTKVEKNNPPKIYWNYTQPIYEASKAVLVCNATGTKISYSWIKNGKGVGEGTEIILVNTLEIDTESRRADPAGYYQCIVKNTLGVVKSDKVYVDKLYYQQIDIEKYRSEIEKGGYVKMICPGQEKYVPPPKVIWQKNDIDIPSDTRRLMDADGALHITYVRDGDEGIYKCLAESPKGLTLMTLAEHTLSIKAGSAGKESLIMRNITKSPATGLLGKEIKLRCIVSGGNVIKVKWFDSENKEISGNRISFEETSLVIKKIRNSDEKTYKCLASTEKSNPIEETVTLKVEEIPNFKSQSDHISDLHVSTTDEAVFRCDAKGKPEPQVEWFKNGKLLDLQKLEPHMSAPDSKTIKVTKLCKHCTATQHKNDECKPLCQTTMDMVLSCNASNIHGYVYQNAFLKIYNPTKIMEELINVEYNDRENVTFTCKAETDDETKLTYKWLLNDKSFNVGGVKTNESVLFLNLASLKASKIKVEGKWTCNATNHFSSDHKSAYLRSKSIAAFPQWWILVLVLLLLLLLLLIVCCVCNYLYKNRGSVYPVDEIEHKNGNDPEKELMEYGFHDYQRDVTISTSGTLRSQRSMGSTNSLARAT